MSEIDEVSIVIIALLLIYIVFFAVNSKKSVYLTSYRLSDLKELIQKINPNAHYYASPESSPYLGFRLLECNRYYQITFVDGQFWLQQFEPTYRPITLRTVLPILPREGVPAIVQRLHETAERKNLEVVEDNVGKFHFNGVALGSDPVKAASLAIQVLEQICKISGNPQLLELKGFEADQVTG